MSKNVGDSSEFRQAATEKRSRFLSEFLQFLRENKKWWLAPVLVVLLLLGGLVILGGTGVAPFIYTLF